MNNSKVFKILQHPEIVDELICDLNFAAQEHDSYEYGLPIYNNEAKAVLREIIMRWLMKVEGIMVGIDIGKPEGDKSFKVYLRPVGDGTYYVEAIEEL